MKMKVENPVLVGWNYIVYVTCGNTASFITMEEKLLKFCLS